MIEAVADGVHRVTLELPPAHPPDGAVYIIDAGTDGVHLVDAGWSSVGNRVALTEAFGEVGGGPPSTVTVTHHHADHLGLAGWLRDTWGTRVAMHPAEEETVARLSTTAGRLMTARSLEAWGVPEAASRSIRAALAEQDRHVATPADVHVSDGDLLAVPGRRIRVLGTPGHTAGSICLVDDDARVVFTGDHVLPSVQPGFGLGGDLGDDPLGVYLDSLEKMYVFDDFVGLPGHGRPVVSIPTRAEQLRDRLLRRMAEIATIAARGSSNTVWETAWQVSWSRGWGSLQGEVLLQALAHTEAHLRHLERVKV